MFAYKGPIAVFDSGYGGLTVLNHIRQVLPRYDFIYLGDNARTPYGTRSFDVVYQYALQAVTKLFELGSPLVILACNTASAKALRNIQQIDLPKLDASRRVLGVIRPSVEAVGAITKTRHVGIFGTTGTIQSESYPIEINHLFPDITVTGEACPMWVPLVENDEADKPGADYFVRQHIQTLLKNDPEIDTAILGCTHYPLLKSKIKEWLPSNVSIVEQGKIVANSLMDYLQRHPEMEARCTKGGTCSYYTTESPEKFKRSAGVFLNDEIEVQKVTL